MRLGHLVEEVAGPQRPFGVEIDVEPRRAPAPNRSAAAIPASLRPRQSRRERRRLRPRARRGSTRDGTTDAVAVTIRDDGPGFAPDVLARLGEPYVTTRGRSAARTVGVGGGMGLGLFIAKTLLERSGARADDRQCVPRRRRRGHGSWPRLAFERGVAVSPARRSSPHFRSERGKRASKTILS